MKLTIDIKNIKDFQKAFDKFGDEAIKTFEEVTLIKAMETEAEAKRLAPVDKGTLRQNIKQQKIDNLNYKITSYMPYSAYMEFGTGKMVQVPEELYEIAKQFKGKGIREVNIPPQPFMYPAFVKARITYLKDLKNALQQIINKRNG